MTPYIYMVAAIVLEIAGTFCLKLSNGFERPVPSVLAFIFYGLMNIPFILALKALPLSLVYTFWAGIGVIAAAAIGMTYFGEAVTANRIVFIAITVIGVIGLQWELAR